MKYKKIYIIIVLLVLLIALIVMYIKQDSNSSSNFSNMRNFDNSSSGNTDTAESENSKETISATGEVKSALIEQASPHATYILSEVCVEKGQALKKGENILKYTDETYMSAPYDLIITGLELPSVGGEILNNHYVEISSINSLEVALEIDETNVSKLNIGDKAEITVSSNDKKYEGYITKISSVISDGNCEVTVQFENDGNIKLGMSAQAKIISNKNSEKGE